MALCLATSLVEKGGLDARDQMERYCRWHEQGYLSSNGVCLDIGNTASGALRQYRRTGEPLSRSTAVCIVGLGPAVIIGRIPASLNNGTARTVRAA
jgi:ADP-ribosyl-[dinitrogen reductase] hydrolase